MTQQPSSSPVTTQLEAGTYWICTCGRSARSPHCDGSHQGTSFQPLTLELESPKVIEIER